jgi:hypothetical protein
MQGSGWSVCHLRTAPRGGTAGSADHPPLGHGSLGLSRTGGSAAAALPHTSPPPPPHTSPCARGPKPFRPFEGPAVKSSAPSGRLCTTARVPCGSWNFASLPFSRGKCLHPACLLQSRHRDRQTCRARLLSCACRPVPPPPRPGWIPSCSRDLSS